MSVTSYIFGRKYGSALLDGLVAYYALENNANDLSGNGNNGILLNSPTFVAGKVNNAMNCGTDTISRGFVVIDNDDFSFTNGTTDVPFTISMWVNFSSISSIANFLANKRNATSGGDEWQFNYSTANNRLFFWKFQFNNNAISQRVESSTSPFSLNTWHHICYTDDGSGLVGSGKIYINGVDDTTTNSNIGGTYTRMNNGIANSGFGYAVFNNTETLKHKGLLDEIAIWKNRELTQDEVTELYNKGNAGLPLI